MVNLDRYVKSCNTLNHLSNNYAEDKTNKTEDLNLSISKIIAEINESKTLTKRISCNANFMEENVIQINGAITINVDLSL